MVVTFYWDLYTTCLEGPWAMQQWLQKLTWALGEDEQQRLEEETEGEAEAREEQRLEEEDAGGDPLQLQEL